MASNENIDEISNFIVYNPQVLYDVIARLQDKIPNSENIERIDEFFTYKPQILQDALLKLQDNIEDLENMVKELEEKVEAINNK